MPDDVLGIATDVRSLEEAIGWQRLAGSSVGKVAANELHRMAKPKDFTAESLAVLLSLDDKFSVGRIGALPRDLRDAVSSLSLERQRTFARNLGTDELTALGGYVQGLKHNAAVRLVASVADEPRRMKLLSSPSVLNAILTSRDQDAAVGLMLREGSLIDLITLQSDFNLVSSGDVSPI